MQSKNNKNNTLYQFEHKSSAHTNIHQNSKPLLYSDVWCGQTISNNIETAKTCRSFWMTNSHILNHQGSSWWFQPRLKYTTQIGSFCLVRSENHKHFKAPNMGTHNNHSYGAIKCYNSGLKSFVFHGLKGPKVGNSDSLRVISCEICFFP